MLDTRRPLVTDFGMLSAILAFRPQARQRVRLLVSLESSAAALPDCARFFDGLGFVSVALDPVDPSYLERVLRASAAMMGASLSDAVLAATVEAAVRSGETLGYTLSLLKGLGTAGADVAGPQWFFKGATSIDDRDALSLLLLVEGCHWCMCRRMPLAALQALYEYHCGVGAPFADVAARLVDGGWLVVDNDEALTDSPWSEGHPITQVWQEALQHPRWTRLSGQAARWVALTALAVRTRLAIPARQAIFNGAKAIAAQRWHSDALLLWRAKLEDVEELSLSQCLEDLDFLAYLWASVGHRPGYVRDIQSLMASKERRDALWTHAIVFMRKAGWREECESFMAWLLHGTAEERVERGYEVFNRVAHSNYSDWDWLVRTYRLL